MATKKQIRRWRNLSIGTFLLSMIALGVSNHYHQLAKRDFTYFMSHEITTEGGWGGLFYTFPDNNWGELDKELLDSLIQKTVDSLAEKKVDVVLRSRLTSQLEKLQMIEKIESEKKNTFSVVLLTSVSTFISLLATITTTLLLVFKGKRETALMDLEIEQKRLELEKQKNPPERRQIGIQHQKKEPDDNEK